MIYRFIRIPFVTFEVFKFNPQHVILVVRQHVYVLVAQPELLGGIAESIFVVGPVSVEVLPRLAEVIPPLNNLWRDKDSTIINRVKSVNRRTHVVR